MSDEQTTPQSAPSAPLSKPSLAPGVKTPTYLSGAAAPTGPGLPSGPAKYSPPLKPSLGAPKPRLIAKAATSATGAANYKVSAPQPTQLDEAFPIPHLVASGLAATVAISTAVLIFLKF